MLVALVPQFDGSSLARLNCFSAEGAMLVSFETGGTKAPTAAAFRSNVRNLDMFGNPTSPDVAGGGKPTQIVETARRAYGVVLDYQVMPFEDAYRLGLRDDVEVGFSISYAPVSNGPLDGSPGFTGFHGIVFTGGLVYDPLADGRISFGQQVPNGPQKWPKALLRRAAGKYASVGEGRAACIVAHAPAVKPKHFSVLIEPGAIYRYRLDGTGQRFRDSFPKKTSAPCTAPLTIRWKGGLKRLVEITEGRLEGWGVEPTATHLRLVEAKT